MAFRSILAEAFLYLTDCFIPFRADDGFLIDSHQQLTNYYSIYVHHEMDDPLWLDWLKHSHNPVVFDIGANIGTFTRYVLDLKPSAQVHMFEPQCDCCDYLREAFSLNLNAQLHPYALGTCRCDLKLNRASKFRFSTSSLVDYAGQGETETVPVVSLDELHSLPTPDIVKIDVDGFERQVLAGGWMTLAKAKFLIIEIVRPEELNEVAAMLPGFSYRKLKSHDYFFTHP